jgi:DNA-binding MarR family transcriptional regulator
MLDSMPDTAETTAAREAWTSILALVGWGGNRPPRFPSVAVELGLSPKQMGVVFRIEPGDAVPMRTIAEQLYCDASYVTDLADRLEERGLVVRGADPADRRVKLLALTDEGEELRKRALDLLYEPPEELMALSDEERSTLSRLLAKALASSAAE